MKYVIVGSEFEPRVVIGNDVAHTALEKAANGRATGAGFFHIVDGVVETYGESVGLGIGPAERDAYVINSLLGL